ncbi:MAG: hypothetical protein KGL39_12085 [Patescibacteria group bacterium]|nr:hypothetical protein [Patescibacteria group bacterium]
MAVTDVSGLSFLGLSAQAVTRSDGTTVLELSLDPDGMIGTLLGLPVLPKLTSGPTAPVIPTQPGTERRVTFRHMMDLFFSDPRGRIRSAGSMIKSVSPGPQPTLTLVSAATDYLIPMPTGARGVTLRLEPPSGSGTPTNNIQGYFSTGIVWPPHNPSGLAYDGSQVNTNNSGYTGIPLRPSIDYTWDVDAESASIHVATSVANTVAIVGWTK